MNKQEIGIGASALEKDGVCMELREGYKQTEIGNWRRNRMNLLRKSHFGPFSRSFSLNLLTPLAYRDVGKGREQITHRCFYPFGMSVCARLIYR